MREPSPELSREEFYDEFKSNYFWCIKECARRNLNRENDSILQTIENKHDDSNAKKINLTGPDYFF